MPRIARAAEPLRVGVILPMSGPFDSTGRQVDAAVRLFVARNGDTVAGRKIELIVRDDTGLAPETTKRIAQEMVVQEQVGVLAGFGLTPLALAAAPIATRGEGADDRDGRRDLDHSAEVAVHRAHRLHARAGHAAARATGRRRTASGGSSRWSPTTARDSTRRRPSSSASREGGGTVVESIRAPLRNPDYAPFLQRAKDAKPDALFVFVPSGEGTGVLKQFVDRGLKDAGIRLICTGDVLDDDLLEAIGPAALGVISSHHYSAAHDSPENKAFVDGVRRRPTRACGPNFHAVGGYDGMQLALRGAEEDRRRGDGERAGRRDEGSDVDSPRGPITIDATTRDIVQTVYLREVKRVDGKLWNVEFDKVDAVRDPG